MDNNEQLWSYEGVIASQTMYIKHGWSLKLLHQHATRVKIKQPEPTHHVIKHDDLERITTWFKHASNNVSIDLTIDDYRLNVELLKILDGVTNG